MGLPRDDDLIYAFGELGEDLSCGGNTTKAWKEDPDEEALAALDLSPVIGQAVVFVFKTGTLPEAIPGAVVVFHDGSKYRVRQPMRTGDGATTRLLCTVL